MHGVLGDWGSNACPKLAVIFVMGTGSISALLRRDPVLAPFCLAPPGWDLAQTHGEWVPVT